MEIFYHPNHGENILFFAIPGIKHMDIGEDFLIVTKEGSDDWRVLGPKIGTAVREQMALWQREGKVLKVVAGENWSIFDRDSQDLRARYAFLGKDEDLDRGNAGMTLVEFPVNRSRIFQSL